MIFDTARYSQNRCTNHKLGTHWLWLHNHHSSRSKELLCNRRLHDGFWYLIPTFLSFQVQVIVFFNCWFTFYASKPKNLCLMSQKKDSMGNNIAPWDDKLNFRTVHLHIYEMFGRPLLEKIIIKLVNFIECMREQKNQMLQACNKYDLSLYLTCQLNSYAVLRFFYN